MKCTPSFASISIAMGTYNGERYLPELLDSLAVQSVQPSELVVCDDGSADATLKLINQFSRTCPYPVRIFRNQTPLRPTKNFEKAITLCRGDFIALCDQDDIWYPDKLSTLIEWLNSKPDAGGIFSDADLIDESSAKMGERLWRRALFKPSRGSGFMLEPWRLLRGNVVTGATLMFRSDISRLFLPIPPAWMHDGWIAWMLALQSKLIACDRPLIGYRIHASQQTGMPGLSPGARLRRARETGARDYFSIAAQFSDLLDWVKARPEICSKELKRRIEGKRDHALFRADLAPGRWPRWRAIWSRRSDYSYYAQGWLSMLKDSLS
jgi:glycosyltransferase involved in cell wall biosynthesis